MKAAVTGAFIVVALAGAALFLSADAFLRSDAEDAAALDAVVSLRREGVILSELSIDVRCSGSVFAVLAASWWGFHLVLHGGFQSALVTFEGALSTVLAFRLAAVFVPSLTEPTNLSTAFDATSGEYNDPASAVAALSFLGYPLLPFWAAAAPLSLLVGGATLRNRGVQVLATAFLGAAAVAKGLRSVQELRGARFELALGGGGDLDAATLESALTLGLFVAGVLLHHESPASPLSWSDAPKEVPSRRSVDQLTAGESVDQADEQLSFFAPGRRRSSSSTWGDVDDNPDFLPPPAPEPIREGDLGGAVEGEGGPRSEGFYAALLEAPDRLRASDLNEVLQPDHLDRLRFTNFPLQAYGAIFKWEVLVRDAIAVYRRPWAIVAESHGLPMPDDDDVLRAVGMRPERAIMQNFGWTDDWGTTQQYAFEHYEARSAVMTTHDFAPAEGVVEWLEMLSAYQVPCCLCAGAGLDSAGAISMLERAKLSGYFETLVTAEDGCETTEQAYLVSSVKMRRPPSKCVVFEDDPRGVTAAHDAMIKVVGIVGGDSPYTGADLRNADMRVMGLDDLSLMSMREIFKDAKAM